MLVPYLQFTKGANTNISPLLHPADAPVVLNGCTNSWKIGAITKDTGYYSVMTTDTGNPSVLGMYHFIQDANRTSPIEKFFATSNDSTAANTVLRYRANGSGTGSNITVGSTWNGFTNQNVEMQGFIGYCFIVGCNNANTYLPVASVTGTTFSTSANVTGMPQAKYITRYRDRLYVANVYYGSTQYPFRIVASSPVTAGAITWSTAGSPDSSTGGFLDVDFSYEITGITSNWDRLMVFTDQSAYYYDQSAFKQIWNTGCSNQRTLKNKGQYMIWANTDGVWLSTGGYPQNISGEVRDFISNSTPSSYFAEIVDEIYYLYVGNVTVNGISYSNLMLQFDMAKSLWSWREFYNNMTCFGRYFNSSKKNRLYMGDTTGTVWDKSKYSDATIANGDAQATLGTGGQPIGSNFELAPMAIDNYELTKIVRDIYVFADRAQGLNLKARVLNRNSRILTPYKPIGQLTQYINTFQVNVDNGLLLQIGGSDYSTHPYWSFYGYALEVDKQSRLLRKSTK